MRQVQPIQIELNINGKQSVQYCLCGSTVFSCLTLFNQVNHQTVTVGFRAVSKWTKCIKCKLICEELNIEQKDEERVANTSEIRRKATNEGVFILNVQIGTYYKYIKMSYKTNRW